MRTGKFVWLAMVAWALAGCGQSSAPPAPVAQPATHPAVPAALPPEPEKSIEVPEPTSDPAVHDDGKAEAAIRAMLPGKKALSKELWDGAGTINDLTHIGTVFNEVDVEQHNCFILGSLLDRNKVVKKLEVKYEPDYTIRTDDNAQDLRISANSLDNFVLNAERILAMSRDERILEWNLDCVDKMGIPKSAFVEQNGQSTFYVVKYEGTYLQVLGDIEPGYSQKIIDAIEANPKVKTVALGSGGGLVYEAFAAGSYIRKKGLETALWNNCFSACPLVFMGGTQRTNMSPYSDLGFHQVYSKSGEPAPLDGQVYKDIYAYLISMDIEPRYVIRNMWSAPPQDMKIIDGYEDELCEANIFTWVQRGCISRSYKSAAESE